MSVSIALFTRDLRVHDNPVLHAAAERGAVVPLFVLDPDAGEFAGPNRRRFLDESLHDLDKSLRRRGGRLVLRHGDPAEEVCRVVRSTGASAVHIAADHSAFARRREDRLAAKLGRIPLHVHEEVHSAVAPGRVVPDGKDHYAVFTPFHRRWAEAPLRPVLPPPRALNTPDVPGLEIRQPRSTDWPGGETAGRRRMHGWLSGGIDRYADVHDDLAADATSRLSPYLHFGCVSPVELIRGCGRSAGAREFVRQLAWREFHLQVLAARPDVAWRDYRHRGEWREDADALAAWREGMTGHPLVDAGMRQLLAEGWMHNRARLVTGSFLTKTLGLDWRAGAAHFFAHLVDGDVANNCLNWQWVAGTGLDTRPNRALSPLRQAERFDPSRAYVRRWVPELDSGSYPDPIVPQSRRT